MSTEMTRLQDVQEEDYGVGIGIAKIISFLGWLVVGIGLILLPALASAAEGEGSFIPILVLPLSTAVAGLLIVASGQASRALFDGANDARRIRIDVARILNGIKSESQ